MESILPAHEYLELVLSAIGIVVALYGFIRWSTKKLEAKIVEVTRPIQPGENGGKSLDDLHVKVDRVLDRMERIEYRVGALEREVDFDA